MLSASTNLVEIAPLFSSSNHRLDNKHGFGMHVPSLVMEGWKTSLQALGISLEHHFKSKAVFLKCTINHRL